MNTPLFTHIHTVRLYQTDGTGVLFFGQIFSLVQDALEEFIFERGVDIAELIHVAPFLLPVAHAEADYHRPIELGETVAITLWLQRRGEKSFSIRSEIRSAVPQEGTPPLLAEVSTTHVAVDRESNQTIPLPLELDPLFSPS